MPLCSCAPAPEPCEAAESPLSAAAESPASSRPSPAPAAAGAVEEWETPVVTRVEVARPSTARRAARRTPARPKYYESPVRNARLLVAPVHLHCLTETACGQVSDSDDSVAAASDDESDASAIGDFIDRSDAGGGETRVSEGSWAASGASGSFRLGSEDEESEDDFSDDSAVASSEEEGSADEDGDTIE